MILFGVLMGPSCIGFIGPHSPQNYHTIKLFANIGVIILLFMAGLETNVHRLIRSSKTGFNVAFGGMILPFVLGFAVTLGFTGEIHTALIMGIILTATSVSVTVITLMEMQTLRTPEGSSIITAAIIDDILGILLLSFILGLLGSTGRPIWISLMVIFIFVGASILSGMYILPVLLNLMSRFQVRHGVLALSICLLFIFSWTAEKAGIAAITGAYLVGIFIGQTKFREIVNEGIETIGQSIFISVFFISIGLQLNLRAGDVNVYFVIALIVVAMLGKVLGSGLGARISGFSLLRSLRIGLGMMPRGEVALVIASISMNPKHGAILSQSHLTTVVLIVLCTCILTPLFLKITFKEKST
jgi:Kef-type K+ transport system membrane component KefB